MKKKTVFFISLFLFAFTMMFLNVNCSGDKDVPKKASSEAKQAQPEPVKTTTEPVDNFKKLNLVFTPEHFAEIKYKLSLIDDEKKKEKEFNEFLKKNNYTLEDYKALEAALVTSEYGDLSGRVNAKLRELQTGKEEK